MRDQRGFTLIELLVSLSMSLVVLAAVFAITTSVLRHQDRIVRRVDANSRGRPVMTHVVQGLHSACVTSHIVPVRTGSTGTSIDFLSKAGSAPGLQPDMHRVTLTGSTLTETVFGASNSTPPDYGGFTTTITPTTTLLTNVSAPSGVIFRYYRYLNGALSTTPLPTPLSSSDAALTSYVTVSFMSQPGVIDGTRRGVNAQDPNSPLMMNSGVDLRLENAGQYPNQDNLPCV